MYSTVYVDKEAKREEKKVDKLISELYTRLSDEPGPDAKFLYADRLQRGR